MVGDHLIAFPVHGMLVKVLVDEGAARFLPCEVRGRIVRGREASEVGGFRERNWCFRGHAVQTDCCCGGNIRVA